MAKTTAEQAKEYRLRTVYKQTPEEHAVLKASQGNKCALCPRTFDKFMAYQDHDHKCCKAGRKKQRRYCGKCNRGLLCFICNKKVIGALEYIEKLGVDVQIALDYLNKWGLVLLQKGAYEPKTETKTRKARKVRSVQPAA